MIQRNDLGTLLANHLETDLSTAGIRAKIETEPVPGTQLVRVYVVADQFAHLRPTERQDLVWRIVSRHFTADDQLRISMIYTVTEEERPE